MTITITAFAASPDGGQGLARDMPVRWALEEVGQPYDVRLVTFDEMKQPAHRSLQPFGQIPTYQEGDLVLFESGAIVLRIAEQGTGLLPTEPSVRARAISWMFAALNTVEPPVVELDIVTLIPAEQPWRAQREPLVEQRIRDRLTDLAARLGDQEWLDGAFSAGDLLMVSVLRRLKGTGIVEAFGNLAEYVARAEARPAFKRAFAAQRAVYEAGQSAEGVAKP